MFPEISGPTRKSIFSFEDFLQCFRLLIHPLAKSHLEQKSRYTKIAAYYEILYKINVGGEAKAAACAQ